MSDFAAELEQYSWSASNPALNPLVERLRKPVGVAVSGRRGVGSSTVAEALRRRDVHVVDAARAELLVLVMAEVVKPEDLAARTASELPTVTVFTKVDVCRPPAGTDAILMSGLLALVSLDDDAVAALRSIAAEPPGLGSMDAFLSCPHRLGRDVRVRLLERLDRFGVVSAARALADGQSPDAVVALLHRLSNVDAVVSRVDELAAEARYRRVQDVLAELRVLAATNDDERLWRFLAADATVAAVMAAALDVLDGDAAEEPGRCALRWARYGRGPVTALHRACAADVVRGSLRRLDRIDR